MERATVVPLIVPMGKDNRVQIESEFDIRQSDLFEGQNNMNYQSGNNKWYTSKPAAASWLDFSQYGCCISVPVTGAGTSTVQLRHNGLILNPDLADDLFCGVTYKEYDYIDDAKDIYRVFRIRLYNSGSAAYVEFNLYFGTAASIKPGIQWDCTVNVPPGSFSDSGVVAAGHPLYNLITHYKRNVSLSMIISSAVQIDTVYDSIALYVNGYCIASLSPTEAIASVGVVNMRIYSYYVVGAGAFPITFETLFRDFFVLPAPIYGGGSIPYELAMIHDPTIIEKAHSSVRIGLGTPTYPIIDFVYIAYKYSLTLKSRCASGFYPLNVTMPMSASIIPITLEHVYKYLPVDRYGILGGPIAMIDRSLELPDDYIDSGAIYDAEDDECGLGVSLDTQINTGTQMPDVKLNVRPESRWDDLDSGSITDSKMNLDNTTVIPVNTEREVGGNMRNESSYGGVMAQFFGMGSNEGDGVGNCGWPIGCDRAPSSPLELYKDNVAPTIVFQNAMRYFRFVQLDSRNTDRLKALFVAYKETNVPAGDPETWNLNVVVGRIKNNDMIDFDVPFSSAGYRVIGTSTCTVMHDLPQYYGTTGKAFRCLPDIALVHLGNPDITTEHRVYWIDQGITIGTYDYIIKYQDFSDNGEIDGVSGSITLSDLPFNPYNLGETRDSILQFDIIQPEVGKFILITVMGDATWVPGGLISDDVVCCIYESLDGITFIDPVLFRGDGLFLAVKSNLLTPTLGFPHLTYSRRNNKENELLLGLINIDEQTDASDRFQGAIFKKYLGVENWTKDLCKPWELYFNCSMAVQEKVYYDDQTYILGTAAFRDRHNKIHVAINKVAYGNDYEENYYAGMYYVVLDDSKQGTIYNASMGRDYNSPSYDVVSFSRFAQHNRRVDSASTYNSYAYMRPSFSPVDDDCYFTFNTQYLDGLITTYTDKGRDILYRLFQPTDLGELYPPGPMWHYSMSAPNNAAVAVNSHIWRKTVLTDNSPILVAEGLEWIAATFLRTAYTWYDYTDVTDGYYDHRFPVNCIAIKTRFRHNGVHAGLPMDLVGSLSYSINFHNIVWGYSLDTPVHKYTYLEDMYFIFNEDSIIAGNNPLAPTWSMTGLDFTVFRDIYITGYHDAALQTSYWNIYVERVPDAVSVGVKERWMPKTFEVLNEVPIEGPTNTINSVLPTFNEIDFGGYTGANPVICVANSMDVKYFQVYIPLFKDQAANILSDDIGTKIDSVISGNYCPVSGVTEGHPLRPRIYDVDNSRTLLSQNGIFQICNRNERDSGGLFGSSYQSYVVDDSVVNHNIRGISVGNNTRLDVINSGITNLDITAEFVFKYGFKFNIGNMLDGNPFTYWACQNVISPVRICIDSMELKTPLAELALDSIWMLNCNLINVRLKGNNVPAVWGAAPFDEYISFIIDRGTASSVYGTVGVDEILTVVDITKNWIPNQFKDIDSPYYIINNDSAVPWVGGRIISNTNDSINYKISTQLDGSLFTDFAITDRFAIVAPHVFKKFDQVYSYQYWALEIMPNEAGDYSSYCDGVAKISELGLGICIPFFNYGDIGLSLTLKNITEINLQNDGHSSISTSPTRMIKELRLTFSNVSRLIKDKLVDIFNDHVISNKSFWFLWNEFYEAEPMLCTFISRSLNITEVFVDKETLDNQSISDEMLPIYTVTMDVGQRT